MNRKGQELILSEVDMQTMTFKKCYIVCDQTQIKLTEILLLKIKLTKFSTNVDTQCLEMQRELVALTA